MLREAMRWGKRRIQAEIESGAWRTRLGTLRQKVEQHADPRLVARVERAISLFWPVDLSSAEQQEKPTHRSNTQRLDRKKKRVSSLDATPYSAIQETAKQQTTR